jgi:hypothetical protein
LPLWLTMMGVHQATRTHSHLLISQLAAAAVANSSSSSRQSKVSAAAAAAALPSGAALCLRHTQAAVWVRR